MDIAEILIYRQFLDDEQEHLVGAWLAMKYHLLTDYLDMTSQLASLPPSKRTAVQQQHLRIHFLKQHHREYRERQKEVKRLTAHKTSLEAQRLAVKVMFPKEDGGRNLRVHRRGNRFDLGEETPRRVPLQFADENRVIYRYAPKRSTGIGPLDCRSWQSLDCAGDGQPDLATSFWSRTCCHQ